MVMGRAELRGAVEAHHQRLERRLGDVVELVDGEQDARAVVACHLAQLDEEPGEVGPRSPESAGPATASTSM